MKRAPLHNIVLWKWNSQPTAARARYTAEHVNIMAAMLKRSISETRYRIICVTDDPAGITECETYPLWDDCSKLVNATKPTLPSCYRRLKLFDLETQFEMGMRKGDRVVSIDLDGVITNTIDAILQMRGRFVGWEMIGSVHPRVFNGSFFMFDAGDLPYLWETFNPDTSPQYAAARGFRGSDQAWLSMHMAPHLDVSAHGIKWPQIASYPLQTKMQGLSTHNRIVFFHGLEKPWMAVPQVQSKWISRFYTQEG